MLSPMTLYYLDIAENNLILTEWKTDVTACVISHGKKYQNHKGDWRFYELLNHAKPESIFKLEMYLKAGYEKFLGLFVLKWKKHWLFQKTSQILGFRI